MGYYEDRDRGGWLQIDVGPWVGGFQVGVGGFNSAWAVCGWGAWVAVNGRWCSWLAMGRV